MWLKALVVSKIIGDQRQGFHVADHRKKMDFELVPLPDYTIITEIEIVLWRQYPTHCR